MNFTLSLGFRWGVWGARGSSSAASPQELLICPILEDEAARRLEELNRPKPKEEIPDKYRVKAALALDSQFEKDMYNKEMERILEEQRQVRASESQGSGVEGAAAEKSSTLLSHGQRQREACST